MKEEHYIDRATFLPLWIAKSDSLYLSAMVVWDSGAFPKDGEYKDMFQYLYSPSALLMGLSLEALIKGFILHNNPSLVNGGKFPNSLQTHNLVLLFEKAGMSITEEEKKCLEQLTSSVEWVSKYTVPLKKEEFEAKRLLSNTGYFDVFEQLRLKVFEKYNYTPTKPLDKMARDIL